MEGIRQVANWLVSNKFADFTHSKQDPNVDQDRIFIYWRSPAEVSSAIFKWAKDGGRIGSIETVLDIIEDDLNKDEIFFNMPIEIVLNSLYIL